MLIFTIEKLYSLTFYLNDSFRNNDDILIFMLMGILFFLFALVIGVVTTVILMAILFVLVSGGIISASLLVGFQRKSLEKGFKTFVLLASIAGATIFSIVFFCLVNTVKNWWTLDVAIIAGSICGLFSGWILGLLIFQTIKKLTVFLKDKYQNRIKKD